MSSSINSDVSDNLVESKNTNYTSNSSFVYSSTTILAIFSVICIVVLYLFKSNVPSFQMIVWIGFPILIYILSSCLNMMGQHLTCKSINAGKGFLTALTTLVSVYLFMLLSKIQFLRLPIGSIIAPFVAPANEVCKLSLKELEEKYPIVLSIATSYYVFWGVVFGQIITSGMSAACS